MGDKRTTGAGVGPDYANWVPAGMVWGLTGATSALAVGQLAAKGLKAPAIVRLGLGIACCGTGAFALWSAMARNRFSYQGKRQLSRAIVEGTASRVEIVDGGVCLDVGCGSGALTIAVAKRNPQARVVGIDRWGKEYASFSKGLCERNARAEGVSNTSFEQADACALPFADGTFDAVTSNYVYHNIAGANKQGLLRETLRTLKKGGTFAIHDIMSPVRYGDMDAFRKSLLAEGYERVELIPTDNGLFMGRGEARLMMLTGSTLLVGKK